jgi:hypothetical protein
MPKDKKTIEPTTEIPAEAQSIAEPKGTAGPYSKLKREITSNDLKNPAIGRILINQNDDLRTQVENLEKFRAQYFDADKRNGILDERLDSVHRTMTVKAGFLSVASILAGLLPTVWKDYRQFFWPAVICVMVLSFITFNNRTRKQ